MLSRYIVPDMPSADQVIPYLRQIDDNRWYSNFGPLVTAFEARLQQHLAARDKGGKSAIALTTLTTCYHALQIGLQLFRLPPAAHVLIPAVTFPACPLAVRHAGAVPVLADIDPVSWQLTPQQARRAATLMPIHAVMPVAVYGVPVDADAWDAFTEETGIPVIIDAAAALEAQAVPQHCLLAHSLHATKPFSVGEGGVLISRRADWIEEARCISNFGTRMRIAERDGSNAKMSEYHAAVALAQFDRWDDNKQRRARMFAKCHSAIGKAGYAVDFQKGVERTIASALMLQVAQGKVDGVVKHMESEGIFAHRMYLPPLYKHPHFAALARIDDDGAVTAGAEAIAKKHAAMSGSEMLRGSVFGLPFHAFLDDGDIAFMLTCLGAALEKT